jgi:methionyl-tRNA formyltransferase
MGITKNILLVSSLKDELSVILNLYPDLNIKIVNDYNEIAEFCSSNLRDKILISYNTNLIVKKEDLEKCNMCFNIHAASPDFPGRDPHHWAIYSKVKKYGATLHYMTEKVDNGPIIKVNWFDVNNNDSPLDILNRANIEAVKLLHLLINSISLSHNISEDKNLKWSYSKSKRSDLHTICNVSDIDQLDEFNLRVKAFYNNKYPNLFIEKFGKKFFLDLK